MNNDGEDFPGCASCAEWLFYGFVFYAFVVLVGVIVGGV